MFSDFILDFLVSRSTVVSNTEAHINLVIPPDGIQLMLQYFCVTKLLTGLVNHYRICGQR